MRHIYNCYYSNKGRDRYDALVKYTRKFLDILTVSKKSICIVDEIKCLALIDSYFLDVIRFKEYHFYPKDREFNPELGASEEWLRAVHCDKMLSPSKVGAYTAKWILKYCPIIIVPRDDQELTPGERRELLSANAMLALQFSLACMGLDVDDVDPGIAREMLYHFRFRGFDDRAFFLQYYTLEKLTSLRRGLQDGADLEETVIAPAAFGAETPDRSNSDKNTATPELSNSDRDKAASGLAQQTAAKAAKPTSKPKTKRKASVASEEFVLTKRQDAKTYSVFLASPSDCETLRNVAKSIIKEFNDTTIDRNRLKFNLFAWEDDKRAGIQNGEFQKRIFDDAASKWGTPVCDVLIFIVHRSFGEGTTEEYDYYIEQAKLHAPAGIRPAFLGCHYNKSVAPGATDGKSLARLQAWLEKHHNDWAEISPVRGSVKSSREYADALRKALNHFLNETSTA
ncbi:MAG: hypothetical protein JNM13_10205 [Hyphomicrobiaceae bacterium]|nr:hypothetical protein [Hyphomicrobiaceae bacterium]